MMRIVSCIFFSVYFFFFQAEDGIRDRTVTGVQTCALPIYVNQWHLSRSRALPLVHIRSRQATLATRTRSEERRVGKECRSRMGPDHEKKKKKIREDSVNSENVQELTQTNWCKDT